MTNQELIALVKKHPVSIGCGLLSVGLLLTLYFRAGDQADLETQLADKTAQVDRYTANIKHSIQLEEQLNAVAAANKEIESRAVRINELGVNSQYFYKLEGETGVKLIDFRQTTQSAPKGKTGYLPVGFTVSAQGQLSQALQFLRLLESGTHYCRVLSASLTTGGANRGGTVMLTVSLELLGTP